MENQKLTPKAEKVMEKYIADFFKILENENPELFVKIGIMVKQGRSQEVTDIIWPICKDSLEIN